MSKILYFFGLILLSSLWWGQNEEAIQADRPDQSDGIHILNPGSFQLETGFIFEHTDKKLYDIIQSTLLRYGVGPNWEFRILINEGFISDDAFKTPSFGLDPISISAKVALLSQQQIIPAITLVTYLQLPFAASKKNKVDYYAPTVLLAFENEVNSRFVLGYNIGISWDGIEKKPEYLATLSLGYGLSYRWSFFGEYFSSFRPLKLTNHNIDFGASYLLSSDLLLDFAVGYSFLVPGNTSFETFGLTYLFR